jgi:hypothetical protein
MLSTSKLWLPVLLTLASVFPLHAKVGFMSLEELINQAELIVVAKVEKVSGPIDNKRYAEAKVTEVWKGAQLETVEFLASPTWACDVSDAVKGETVVLFLIKRKQSRSYQIVHSGRGRMPQRAVGGRLCVDLDEDVRMPDGITAVTSEKNAWVRCVDVPSLKDIVKRQVEKKN